MATIIDAKPIDWAKCEAQYEWVTGIPSDNFLFEPDDEAFVNVTGTIDDLPEGDICFVGDFFIEKYPKRPIRWNDGFRVAELWQRVKTMEQGMGSFNDYYAKRTSIDADISVTTINGLSTIIDNKTGNIIAQQG